jgi:Zn-dependent protease/CBS domain-containing protein
MANHSLASGLPVARFFGITVRVHVTWLVIFILLAYSLAEVLFPLSSLVDGGWWGEGALVQARMDEYRRSHPGVSDEAVYKRFGVRPWPEWQNWVLGVIGALGLFVCVLAHELSHSLVAKEEGIPVEGITLFIFGGISRIGGEAHTPDAEFKVAAAGPAMSLAIGLGCGLVYWLGGGILPPQALALMFYFMFVNILLMAFNLVPGFPLDGGRLLRAVLWKVLDDFVRATYVASICGRVVAGGLIFAGGLNLLVGGGLIGSFWLVVIGLFLWHAAKASYQQVQIKQALEGLTARDVLREDAVAVGPDLALADLVRDYFYGHRRRSFPVVDDGRVVGHVHLKAVRSVPRGRWSERRVRDVMKGLDRIDTAAPDEDLGSVFRKVMGGDGSYLPVVAEDGSLAGIVTQHDVMNLLQIRTDLDGR